MRAALALAALLALAAAPAAGASKPVRTLTVTYAATAGSELDTATGSFRMSAVCSGTIAGVQEIRDIAWRAKWRRVPLPRPGRSVVVTVPVEFSGAGRVDTDIRGDAACGSDVPRSTECSGPLRYESRRAALRIAWVGRRLQLSLQALTPFFPGGEESEPADDACPLGVRERAFDTDVRAPASSRRLVLRRPTSAANATAEQQARRPHVEEHERSDEFTYDSISDVDWQAVVAVRYNR